MPKRVAAAVGVVVILAVALFFREQPPRDTAPPAAAGSEGATAARRTVTRAAPDAPPALQRRPPATAAEVVEAYDLMGEGGRVRCPAPEGVGDGVYQIVPSNGAASYILVQGGTLTARVARPRGDVFLSQHLARRGRLSWRGADGDGWGACEVTRPARVPIRGQVVWPDGSPAPGHAVQPCEHGETFTSGEGGRFETSAVEGTTCYLIAFLETDDGFGKGEVVTLRDVGPDPVEGVALTLPAEDEIWGEGAQEKMAASLMGLLAKRIQALETGERPDLEALARSDGSPAARDLLAAFESDIDGQIEAMRAHGEMLEDPEGRAQALREAFMGLY